jgi:uncharacterized protein (TIGR02598 family)
MKKPLDQLPGRKAPAGGFSLIEVTLALAIMAFASASIISLVPFGLSSFHQAMNNTVESEIVQYLTNNISLTNFSNLKSMASSQGINYYFDSNGDPLTSATGAIYTAQISFTDLSPGMPTASNPLNTLSPSSGTMALITITAIDKTKDYFTVVVGNNQQVAANSTAATW